MHYLQLLFPPEDRDNCLTFLKKKFAAAVSQVNVETILEDQMLHISWEGLLDPIPLAQEMTEALPTVIIETESCTGIEITSRFFNKTQLW